MRTGTPLRRVLVAVAAGVGSIALASPAWANSTVPHHQSNVTAGNFKQECGDGRFEGKPANYDGWHFVLPGKSSGNFIDLTLTFTNKSGGSVQVKVPDANDSYPDAFYKAGNQTKHAYLFTPAGWTLVTGTATISGTGDKFNLSHTCAGTSSTPPSSPPPSSPPPGSPPPSTPGSPPASIPGSPPASTPGVPGSGGSGENGGGSLPVTGAAAGGIALGGLALVGGGVAAVVVMRRRRTKFVS